MKIRSGQVTIELIIAISLMAFLIFSVCDNFIIFMKYLEVQHYKFYYLQRMRVEGWLSDSDEHSMINQFNAIGCPIVSIGGPEQSGDDGDSNRVLYDPSSVDNSEISLNIVCMPNPQPFSPLSLIGGTQGNTIINVGGTMLSEYVPTN